MIANSLPHVVVHHAPTRYEHNIYDRNAAICPDSYGLYLGRRYDANAAVNTGTAPAGIAPNSTTPIPATSTKRDVGGRV